MKRAYLMLYPEKRQKKSDGRGSTIIIVLLYSYTHLVFLSVLKYMGCNSHTEGKFALALLQVPTAAKYPLPQR